jgi:transcriptional regulator with XRE-family HTH domain
MAGHRNFRELEEKMSPERRARVAKQTRELLEQMLLSEVRALMGMTQQELADAAGMERPNVARLEKQDDIQVSTLRRLVEALGGELEITFKLPDRRISISQFHSRDQHHDDEAA